MLSTAFFAAAILVNAQVYKCTDKSGNVAYGDAPCAESGEVIPIDNQGTLHEGARRAVDRRRGGEAERPQIGMTTEKVRSMQYPWNMPLRVNKTTNARGMYEQWVYSGIYLYFDDGILTAIQENSP